MQDASCWQQEYCSILFNSYVTCHTGRFIRKIFVCHGVQKFIRKLSAGSRGRSRIAWAGIRKFSYVTPVIRILRMDKFVSNVTPKTSYELSKMLQYTVKKFGRPCPVQ